MFYKKFQKDFNFKFVINNESQIIMNLNVISMCKDSYYKNMVDNLNIYFSILQMNKNG